MRPPVLLGAEQWDALTLGGKEMHPLFRIPATFPVAIVAPLPMEPGDSDLHGNYTYRKSEDPTNSYTPTVYHLP